MAFLRRLDDLRAEAENKRRSAAHWAKEAKTATERAARLNREADVLIDQVRLAECRGRKAIDPETFGKASA